MYFKCLVKCWLHICSCVCVSDVQTLWFAWHLMYFVTKLYNIHGQSITCNTSLIMFSNCSQTILCEIYAGICYKFRIWYYVCKYQFAKKRIFMHIKIFVTVGDIRLGMVLDLTGWGAVGIDNVDQLLSIWSVTDQL